MSRARRRRHRSVAKRGWGRILFLAFVVVLGVVLAIGSLVEIHAQSGGFRTSTNTGYGALASRVSVASNQTGANLAALMKSAPQLTNEWVLQTTIRRTARAELQQGLDQAVSTASEEAAQAAHLATPPPTGGVGNEFTQVMTDRATAAIGIRTGIDGMLGMTPLSIAGSPSSPAPSSAAPLTSPDQAASALSASGLLLQHADQVYATLIARLRRTHAPFHLPRSVWVPAPVDASPLGSSQLGQSAGELHASTALIPFHQLIFSAVGLSPPAVSCGSEISCVVGSGCRAPQSTTPGTAPTVLPPTTSIAVRATVTNCGTVVESGVPVSESLALTDPPGAAPPAETDRGGTSQVSLTLSPGSSTALSLHPLAIASSHQYLLTLTIAIPASQHDPTGSTQQFLLRISG